MKKKFFAAILTLVLCIAFAGCGSGDDNEKDKKADQDQPTTIVGSWECEDIEITDNGTKLSKDEMKAMMGEDLTSMMKLNAFEDGTMELSMRADSYPATWTEKNGVYTISAPESGTDGGIVPLKLGEWDQLPNTSYGGEEVYTRYNNGRISITRSHGEGFLTEGDFSTDSKNSIGYSNVKE